MSRNACFALMDKQIVYDLFFTQFSPGIVRFFKQRTDNILSYIAIYCHY